MSGSGGGRCRTCRAPIKWARTTKDKPIPLDPDPTDLGNIELVNGMAFVLTGDELTDARRTNTVLHIAHFATCPERTKKPGLISGR